MVILKGKCHWYWHYVVHYLDCFVQNILYYTLKLGHKERELLWVLKFLNHRFTWMGVLRSLTPTAGETHCGTDLAYLKGLFEGKMEYSHASSYCTSQILCFFVSWKLVASFSKSIDTTFQIAFAHFISLCHILASLPGFQTFSLLWYFLWWSVTGDLWCYHCICFEVPWTTPI